MIIWIASYPKSGNTWMRSFLVSLMLKNDAKFKLNDLENIKQFPSKSQYTQYGINIDFNNFQEVSKYWIQVQKKINFDNKVRFFKTHNALCKIGNNFFTDKENTLGVIYIVRDPRNIITSLKNHYHHTNLEESKIFMFDKSKGIKNATGDGKIILPQILGSWKSHYNSWKNLNKNYLLIKYENLLYAPQEEFRKVVDYLNKVIGLRFEDEQITRAINLSSFENLKTLEKNEGFAESVKNLKTGERKKFFFLGPKNNWQKLLNTKTAHLIEEEFKNEMKELGYL